MGVRRARDVLGAGPELDRDRGLGDHVGGTGPEDVDAEDAIGPCLGHDLDAPLGVPVVNLDRR